MITTGRSGVHGTGAFAARDLQAGEYIGQYEGRRYTARQAARRDWDQTLTYVFGLSDGSLIDAAEGGNATRHLNHSCAPNCHALEETGPRGRLCVRFYALRDVAAGEELFLDYSLVVDDDPEGVPDDSLYRCACGSSNCRGTMRGPASPA